MSYEGLDLDGDNLITEWRLRIGEAAQQEMEDKSPLRPYRK